MALETPELSHRQCLNLQPSGSACVRCRDICPAGAISLDGDDLPQLDASACTACTGCVRACPVDDIGHTAADPEALLLQARRLVAQGQDDINAACSAVPEPGPGLQVPCHAVWDPLLLAGMAAEGVRSLHPQGIDRCDACALRFGSELLQQCENDYAELNRGLAVRLRIERQRMAKSVPPPAQSPPGDEPARRAFFRKLIPSLAQGAADATAQISQAAGQAISEGMRDEDDGRSASLPVRLRLFLRALPRLKPDFTPVPYLPSVPLGSLQADERCTACNRCVELCPTQALSLRGFGAKKILEFQSDACIGCQRCVDLCPEHALELLPGISLPALLTRLTRPLVMVPDRGTRQT